MQREIKKLASHIKNIDELNINLEEKIKEKEDLYSGLKKDLEKIHNSRFWKIAISYYSIRDFLLALIKIKT